jgi:hypothetical protein
VVCPIVYGLNWLLIAHGTGNRATHAHGHAVLCTEQRTPCTHDEMFVDYIHMHIFGDMGMKDEELSRCRLTAKAMAQYRVGHKFSGRTELP